jgi:hypothetical protein
MSDSLFLTILSSDKVFLNQLRNTKEFGCLLCSPSWRWRCRAYQSFPKQRKFWFVYVLIDCFCFVWFLSLHVCSLIRQPLGSYRWARWKDWSRSALQRHTAGASLWN